MSACVLCFTVSASSLPHCVSPVSINLPLLCPWSFYYLPLAFSGSFPSPRESLTQCGSLIVFVNNDTSVPQVDSPSHRVSGSHYPALCCWLHCRRSDWGSLSVAQVNWLYLSHCIKTMNILLSCSNYLVCEINLLCWVKVQYLIQVCHFVLCVVQLPYYFHMPHDFFSLPPGSSKVYPFVIPSCIIQIWLQRSGFLSKTCCILLVPTRLRVSISVVVFPFLFPSAISPTCFSESFSCATLLSLCYSFAR